MDRDARVSVVVLTHNRCAELTQTLQLLEALPERPPIVVVDNASRDNTCERVRHDFPDVQLVLNPVNAGAAARNAGIERVHTPYVAFCDDDTAWRPGALTRAGDLLDRLAQLGVVAARVLVGPTSASLRLASAWRAAGWSAAACRGRGWRPSWPAPR